jgi:hypothetical protein
MFAVKNVAPKRPAPAFVAMALPQTKAIDRHGFRDASPGGCARFVDVRSRHAETAHSLEMTSKSWFVDRHTSGDVDPGQAPFPTISPLCNR